MKKRRINYGAVLNGLLLILSAWVLVDNFYNLIIEPFFTNEMKTLTQFGVVVGLLAFVTFVFEIQYFEERLER